MKHLTKKQVEEESVYLTDTCISLFVSKRNQDRNSNRAGAVSQLAPHGLLSLLSFRTQDHKLRDGNTHQLLVKKMLYRSAYNPIL